MRINEVNYVDKAEKVIKNLAEESKERYRGQVRIVTTSKLRNLLSMTSDIYNQVLTYSSEKLNEELVGRIEYLRVRFMYECGRDGYIIPVLVGSGEELKELAVSRGYDPSVFTIVDINEETYKNQLIEKYVALPGTLLKAKALGRRMTDPLYYAIHIVERIFGLRRSLGRKIRQRPITSTHFAVKII